MWDDAIAELATINPFDWIDPRGTETAWDASDQDAVAMAVRRLQGTLQGHAPCYIVLAWRQAVGPNGEQVVEPVSVICKDKPDPTLSRFHASVLKEVNACPNPSVRVPVVVVDPGVRTAEHNTYLVTVDVRECGQKAMECAMAHAHLFQTQT